jgi:hypothetical protein
MTTARETGPGSAGGLTVRCACGWEWSGDVESIIAATQQHGRTAHDLAFTPEQVLAMARPADDGSDARQPEPPTPG